MNGPLELESLIDQRHEGTLQAVQTERLAKQVRSANRRSRSGWANANSFWESMLSLLYATGLSV